MKQTTLSLPYMRVTLADTVEPHSISNFNQMPTGMFIVPSLAGTMHMVYLYVEKGIFPISDFDENFIKVEIANNILTAIKKMDLFGDGTGDPLFSSIPDGWLKEDCTPKIGWNGLSEAVKLDILRAKWIEDGGRSLAENMMKSIKENTDKVGTSVMQLDMNNRNHGDEIARFIYLPTVW